MTGAARERRTRELTLANARLEQQLARQRESIDAIRKVVREKELLLDEVNHRVKNNLQVISSLLRLQKGYVEDEGVRRALDETRDRVRAIAIAHDHATASEGPGLDLRTYLTGVAAGLARSSLREPDRAAVTVQGDRVELGIDAAISCGLIATELIASALCCGAGPGGLVGVFVSVQLEQVQIEFADDGAAARGLGRLGGLGRPLVENLAAQLGGSIAFGPAHTRLTFPAPAPPEAVVEAPTTPPADGGEREPDAGWGR